MRAGNYLLKPFLEKRIRDRTWGRFFRDRDDSLAFKRGKPAASECVGVKGKPQKEGNRGRLVKGQESKVKEGIPVSEGRRVC